MTEFRKIGWREFYKLDGTRLVRVINKEKLSEILTGENWLLTEDVKVTGKPITESEFNEQFDLAMERIQNNRI